jgi:hypothetical protein
VIHYNWVKVRSKDGQIQLTWEIQITTTRTTQGAVKVDRDATHWSRERLIGFAEGYVGEVLDDSKIEIVEDR